MMCLPLGHAHAELTETLREQAGRFVHENCWCSNPQLVAFAEALIATAFAVCLALAQHRLSTAVRHVRRRVRTVRGELEHTDGTLSTLSARSLTEPAEQALQLLTLAVVALAVALLVTRLS